jgi:hypothetical protein
MSKRCEKKQIYEKPKLEKYGDISKITMGGTPDMAGDFNKGDSG